MMTTRTSEILAVRMDKKPEENLAAAKVAPASQVFWISAHLDIHRRASSGGQVSLIVFLTLYFLFLWVSWVLAVWMTEPKHAEPGRSETA
jgi:hypothetical protein